MPRDPEPLKQIEKPTLTRVQVDGLKRHQLSQECGVFSYVVRCSCGWRGARAFRLKNKAQALMAQDSIMRHLVDVAKDLGIAAELLQ